MKTDEFLPISGKKFAVTFMNDRGWNGRENIFPDIYVVSGKDLGAVVQELGTKRGFLVRGKFVPYHAILSIKEYD